jgi:hypothetical protein
LRFIVPNQAFLSFVFRDRGRRSPILIPLGRIDAAPEEASVNLDSHPRHGSHP